MSLYYHLDNAKSTIEMSDIAKEYGIGWTEEQLKLYLMLDPDITKDAQGKWLRKKDEHVTTVIRAIDQALGGKKVAKISEHIMPLLPNTMVITPAEIIAIAKETGRFDAPTENIIRRIN